MVSDTLTGLVLGLGVLMLLALLVLIYLQLSARRRSDGQSGDGSQENQESPAVLQERIQSRDQAHEELRGQYRQLQERLDERERELSSAREQLGRQETQLQLERRQHEEKLKMLQQAREQMTHEFRNLANEILEQKGAAFTERNRENLQSILNPLSEKIRLFEKKVEETYDKESKQRFSLQQEIHNLQELNKRISEDALNLTRALKGESKTQGTWGEVILERVLERSGLRRGSEYEVQVNLRSEEGRSRQPDVIVHLPEGKNVIIDAKVSLSAYERYSSETDDALRAEHLKQHLQSIRNHVKQLSDKDYHQLKDVQSLDFVILFLPVEAAFTLAIQEDNRLFTEAFEKNIMLVGPSTLLATLRTIQNIWRYEHQNRNAMEIAARAGRLYDKFVAFAEELETIGRYLGQTQKSYETARNRLTSGSGNLVGQVEKLKKLGARASKQLSPQMLSEAADEDPADTSAVSGEAGSREDHSQEDDSQEQEAASQEKATGGDDEGR